MQASEDSKTTDGGTWLRRPDGRRLGYRTLGDGLPLFFFHGTPGSRFVVADDELLARVPGLRLILPDRPGYGLSDPQPGRTLLGWADEVAALADHLGYERFAVGGASGGGPHALACGFRLPERVTRVLLVASPCPGDVPAVKEGLTFENTVGYLLQRFAPWALRKILRMSGKSIRHDPVTFLEKFGNTLPSSDRQFFENPDTFEGLLRDLQEALANGVEGYVADSCVLATRKSWGFPLDRLRVPVHLWHGNDDILAPSGMGRYLEAEIPGCRARYLEGAGHLLTLHEGVVAEMVEALGLERPAKTAP